MISKLFLPAFAVALSIGLVGCGGEDTDGRRDLTFSKEGMGKSPLEMESEYSRQEALKQRSNTLPPPREDGQHDIVFPSWIGGAEKRD